MATTSCSSSSHESGAGPSTTAVAPTTLDNLYLYVSNQSFQHPSISVDVEIDHARVVSQTFEVGTQHNVVAFNLSLPTGEHLLTASASDGTTASGTVAIPTGTVRYATLFYWSDPYTPSMLDLKVTERKPAFG